jgi:hypothetical protein
MDTNSYLILTNVFTGFMLIMTCGVAIWRRRIINCPYCTKRIAESDLQSHFQTCAEHNNLYMGRFSPSLTALTVFPYAEPVPLPPSFALQPTGGIKVANL